MDSLLHNSNYVLIKLNFTITKKKKYKFIALIIYYILKLLRKIWTPTAKVPEDSILSKTIVYNINYLSLLL